jgi:hypothetical protein
VGLRRASMNAIQSGVRQYLEFLERRARASSVHRVIEAVLDVIVNQLAFGVADRALTNPTCYNMSTPTDSRRRQERKRVAISPRFMKAMPIAATNRKAGRLDNKQAMICATKALAEYFPGACGRGNAMRATLKLFRSNEIQKISLRPYGKSYVVISGTDPYLALVLARSSDCLRTKMAWLDAIS